MKINFKKVASVLATTFMLGSTIAFASAAYPAPFVNNGSGDAAIVYGAAAPATGGDMAQATDLGASLEKSVTTVSNAAPTGEVKALATDSQKLYLKDSINGTKATLIKDDLPTLLADQTVLDTDGTSYTVTQKIVSPNTNVRYGKTTDNLASPVLYMDWDASGAQYESDVVFTPAVNVTKLADKEITLFGKKFAFSGNAGDLTSTQVVLFENANSKVVNSGETVSVNVGGTAYTVTVNSVESATEALISVNGVSQKVTEGSSYKIAGLDVYAKNVIGPNVAGESRGVELSMGAAKLTLQNGNSVTKGSTSVTGTTVTIVNSGTKISTIKVVVAPSSMSPTVDYTKLGDSITEPVFGAYKISLNTVTPAPDDASKDQIVIKATGESKAGMTWTNKAGNTYNMDMFMPSTVGLNATKVANATNLGQYTTYNATMLGYDTYSIATTATQTVHKNDYFITTSGQYSQIWRVTSIQINANNPQVTVRDMGSNTGDQTLSLPGTSVGTTVTLSLADGNSATLNLTGNGTDAVGGNVTVVTGSSAVIYTKSGAKIDMSNIADPVTNNQSSGKIVVTEETSYNDGTWNKNLGTGYTLGNTINVTLLYSPGVSGNDMKVDTLVVGDSDSSNVGDYDVYYLTTYGTFVKKTGGSDDKTVTMYYPGTAASIGAYVTSSGAVAGTTGAIPVVSDAQVNSVKDKNLIVVGGSCINTVAASLLGSSSPLCGSAFTAASGAGPNQYLIKVFNSPYATSGKVAMLVAGYEAPETAAAVKVVEGGTAPTEVGKSVIGPTTV